MFRKQLTPLYKNVKVLVSVFLGLFLLILVGLALLASAHTYTWGAICTIEGVVLIMFLIVGTSNYKIAEEIDKVTGIQR